MNKLTFKGYGNEAKGKLKQQYGELSDDDLTFVQGMVAATPPSLEKAVRFLSADKSQNCGGGVAATSTGSLFYKTIADL